MKALAIVLILVLAACASHAPVVYPLDPARLGDLRAGCIAYKAEVEPFIANEDVLSKLTDNEKEQILEDNHTMQYFCANQLTDTEDDYDNMIATATDMKSILTHAVNRLKGTAI